MILLLTAPSGSVHLNVTKKTSAMLLKNLTIWLSIVADSLKALLVMSLILKVVLMSCSSPTLLRNKKTKEILSVPCGHCVLCLAQRSAYLKFLCRKEHYYQSVNGSSSSFVTLTYDSDHIPLDNNLSPKYLQAFMKRFRYHLEQRYGKVFSNFKYFGVGEYGDESERMHYHVLLFGIPTSVAEFAVRKAWNQGFVKIDPVTSYRISYLVDYVVYEKWNLKQKNYWLSQGVLPPFCLKSSSLGLRSIDIEYALEHDGMLINNKGQTYIGSYYRRRFNVPKPPVHFQSKEQVEARYKQACSRRLHRGLPLPSDKV